MRGLEPIVGVELGSTANMVRQFDPQLPHPLPPIRDADPVVLEWLNRLRTLDLNGGEITDVRLGHLTKLRSLEELGLCGTNVSPEGVLWLAERLPNVKTLWLDADLATDSWCAEARSRAPGVTIEVCGNKLPTGPFILVPLSSD